MQQVIYTLNIRRPIPERPYYVLGGEYAPGRVFWGATDELCEVLEFVCDLIRESGSEIRIRFV